MQKTALYRNPQGNHTMNSHKLNNFFKNTVKYFSEVTESYAKARAAKALFDAGYPEQARIVLLGEAR